MKSEAIAITMRAIFDPATRTWTVEHESWQSGPVPLGMFAAGFGCIHGAASQTREALGSHPAAQESPEVPDMIAQIFDEHSSMMSAADGEHVIRSEREQ